MSAVAPLAVPRPAPPPVLVPRVAAVLLGTGLVGSALLRRLRACPLPLRLLGVANSRGVLVDACGLAAAEVLPRLAAAGAAAPSDLDAVLRTLHDSAAELRVVIDATPSDAVARRHAEWLASGLHVVSANKLAAGTNLARWRGLRDASRGGGRYGDAATVGAGLPVLSTLRRLRAAGDEVLALEGVFSGSLSFLFNRLDGTRPFSRLLAEAFECGYTEPDPRIDLAGVDVARKLLILAREAGIALEEGEVQVEGLLPEALAALPLAEFQRRLPELDAAIEAQRVAAAARGQVLRYLARVDGNGRARVGLAAVDPAHPAATLVGAENLFAITSAVHRQPPVVIRGAGAGAEATALALLADLAALAGA